MSDEVDDAECEPKAAHRIGQLVFRAASEAALVDGEALLLVPPGEEAFARHLQLPPGLSLEDGDGNVAVGIRARKTGASKEPLLLATVSLVVGSVFFQNHSKFGATTAVSYRPEVRLLRPYPKGATETLKKTGLSLTSAGVVVPGSKGFAVRIEFVKQLLPDARFEMPPRKILLDFEPLAYHTKAEVLRSTFKALLEEVDAVMPQLDQPVVG